MVCSLLACCQDSFANRLQIMVRKRQSVELIVDEGFYSEQEMKDDLGWTQTSPQITVHFIYSSWTTKIACWIYLGHHIGPGRKSMVPKHGAKRLGKPSAGHSCLHPWKSLNWTLMRTANTREINLYIFRNKSSRSLARFWLHTGKTTTMASGNIGSRPPSVERGRLSPASRKTMWRNLRSGLTPWCKQNSPYLPQHAGDWGARDVYGWPAIPGCLPEEGWSWEEPPD